MDADWTAAQKNGAKGGLAKRQYNRGMLKVARLVARFGVPQRELAKHFGVTPETVSRWIARYPEFARAIQQGRDQADTTVERSLFKRATGYKKRTIKVVKLSTDEIVDHPTITHIEPDVDAAKFWLVNRARDRWSHTADGGSTTTVVSGLDPEVQGAMLRRLRALDEEESRARGDSRGQVGDAQRTLSGQPAIDIPPAEGQS